MWLLHLLPDGLLAFIVNLVLFTGIILTLLSTFVFDTLGRFIPMIAPYRTAFRVLSIVILAFGVYFKGGYNTEMIWRERVAELEAKLKIAEEKSNAVNTVIQEKVIYKNKIIKEKANDIIKKIDSPAFAEKECTITKEVLDIHNEAVDMNKAIEKGESK